MKILKARKEDARKIAKMRKNTFEKILAKNYTRKVINYLNNQNNPSDFVKKMKEREMYCAWKDGELVGTVDLEGNKIGGVFVKHDLIGKGIGTKLMDFIENKARSKGIKNVKLYPTKFAVGFYKKRGYKTVKRFKWKTPYFSRTSIEMRKRLK